MKTFKILYDFWQEDGQHWDLARAVVIAENEYLAEDLFKTECTNYSDIIWIEELNTTQITWAY